jgi:hypothetical protein
MIPAMKLVEIFESSNRIEARMAEELLKDQGLDVLLQCDDAGGLYPGMESFFGCKVLVRPEDADKALEILESTLGAKDS